MRYQVHRILKISYNTTQTTIIETGNYMGQKEEIYKISNKKQIIITKLINTKIDYTKQILIMHYVEYINTFGELVNKHRIFSNLIGTLFPVSEG
jgi:hypothetical protein